MHHVKEGFSFYINHIERHERKDFIDNVYKVKINIPFGCVDGSEDIQINYRYNDGDFRHKGFTSYVEVTPETIEQKVVDMMEKGSLFENVTKRRIMFSNRLTEKTFYKLISNYAEL